MLRIHIVIGGGYGCTCRGYVFCTVWISQTRGTLFDCLLEKNDTKYYHGLISHVVSVLPPCVI